MIPLLIDMSFFSSPPAHCLPCFSRCCWFSLSFDLFSSLCLSFASGLLDSFNPVRFRSPVCLSPTSVILLIHHSSIVSRYKAFPPSYTSPPLPIYFLTSRSLLSRLHRFLSRLSSSRTFSLSNISLTLPPSALLLLPLSGNRCCLSDLIITG